MDSNSYIPPPFQDQPSFTPPANQTVKPIKEEMPQKSNIFKVLFFVIVILNLGYFGWNYVKNNNFNLPFNLPTNLTALKDTILPNKIDTNINTATTPASLTPQDTEETTPNPVITPLVSSPPNIPSDWKEYINNDMKIAFRYPEEEIKITPCDGIKESVNGPRLEFGYGFEANDPVRKFCFNTSSSPKFALYSQSGKYDGDNFPSDFRDINENNLYLVNLQLLKNNQDKDIKFEELLKEEVRFNKISVLKIRYKHTYLGQFVNETWHTTTHYILYNPKINKSYILEINGMDYEYENIFQQILSTFRFLE